MTQTDRIFNEVIVPRHFRFINWLEEWPSACMSLTTNKQHRQYHFQSVRL